VKDASARKPELQKNVAKGKAAVEDQLAIVAKTAIAKRQHNQRNVAKAKAAVKSGKGTNGS